MKKFVRKHLRLDPLLCSVLGSYRKEIAFFERRYVYSIGIARYAYHLFPYLRNIVPTSFLNFPLHLTALVHTDGMISDERLNTHRTYKAGIRVDIAVSFVSTARRK